MFPSTILSLYGNWVLHCFNDVSDQCKKYIENNNILSSIYFTYCQYRLSHCTLCSKLNFLFLPGTNRFLPVRRWFCQLTERWHLVRSLVRWFFCLCTKSTSTQGTEAKQSMSGSHSPQLKTFFCLGWGMLLVCILYDMKQALFIIKSNYFYNALQSIAAILIEADESVDLTQF